jgi:hypothetical protein
MNALYFTISRRIALGGLKKLFSIAQSYELVNLSVIKKDPRWSDLTPEYHRVIFHVVRDAREGCSFQDIRQKHLETFAKNNSINIYNSARKEKLSPEGLHQLFNYYRSLPGLRRLSDYDFYYFITHVLCGIEK